METKKKLRFSKYLKISNERLIEAIEYYQLRMGYDDKTMAKYLCEDLRFFKMWKQGEGQLLDKCRYQAYQIVIRLANRGLFDLEEGILVPLETEEDK